MPEEKYILTLTPDQALMVETACELYARLKIGQFDTITEKLLDVKSLDDYHHRRAIANDLLKIAACIILGRNEYGRPIYIESPEHHRAWNIYTVLRYCRVWNEHPEGQGNWNVCYDKPRASGGEPLPVCRVQKSGS